MKIRYSILSLQTQIKKVRGDKVKIVSFNELKSTDFYITDISSIYQIPSYRILNNPGRRCNGLCIIEEGECIFTWDGGVQKMKKGNIIYLPYGSVHQLNILTENFSFTRVNFTTKNADSETLIFSKTPLIICTYEDGEAIELVHNLNKMYLDATTGFKMKSELYRLFDRLDTISSKKEPSPIKKVTDYIQRHYTEDIPCSKLVELSFLSQASLYRAFKKETGMTPIEYKNHIRMEQAKSMLRTEEYTVNEISDFLGFDSIYYFCRVFRKFAGMSPTKYRRS